MTRTSDEPRPCWGPATRALAALVAGAVAGCAPVLERRVEFEPAGEARPVPGATPSPSRERQGVLDVAARLSGSRVEVTAVRYDECVQEREAPFIETSVIVKRQPAWGTVMNVLGLAMGALLVAPAVGLAVERSKEDPPDDEGVSPGGIAAIGISGGLVMALPIANFARAAAARPPPPKEVVRRVEPLVSRCNERPEPKVAVEVRFRPGERFAPFAALDLFVTEPRRGRIPVETGADGRGVVDLARFPLPTESLGPAEEFQVWRIGGGSGPQGPVRVASFPASAVAGALGQEPTPRSDPDDVALAAVARAWVTATDEAFSEGLRGMDAPLFRALPPAVRAGAHARVELRRARDELSRIDGSCRQHEGREVARLESEAQDLLVRAHRAASETDREALILLSIQVGARNRLRIEEIEVRAHGRDGWAAHRRERESVVRRGAAWLRAVAESGDPRVYVELMLSECTARMPIGLDEESTVRWTLFARDPVCDLAREETTKLPPPPDLAARLEQLPPS